MLPNLNGAKFDILGKMANSAHIRKHCAPGDNNVLKRFFQSECQESLERALLVEYACQINSLSHMVKYYSEC